MPPLKPTVRAKPSPSRRRRSLTNRMSIQSTRRNSIGLATPSKGSGSSNIRVLLRVRPATARELDDGRFRDVVEVVDTGLVIFDPKEEEDPFYIHGRKQTHRDITKKVRKNLQFSFDRVFGPEECTPEVYANSLQTLIPSLLAGYNCTVFAYGATGSGKTHTMLGSRELPGVTPLLMRELYEALEHEEGSEKDVVVSYLEIYNEQVHDLLVDKPRPLQLREDGNSVVVSELSWHRPATAEDLMSMLQQGNLRRTQHPTDANAESSRSHAVFQVHVKIKRVDQRAGQMCLAKLSMIDLAGSERAAATTNSKSRFTEGANINKSLLALGNCINALADNSKHVPFRNSKLTRLLKGSLGGNCQTIMIANVSPSSGVYEDTYNTLKYATRAKKIKNKVKKNVGSTDMRMAEYSRALDLAHKEITALKAKNQQLTAENQALREKQTTASSPAQSAHEVVLLQRVAELEVENETLRLAAAAPVQPTPDESELLAAQEKCASLAARVQELEAEQSARRSLPSSSSPAPPSPAVAARLSAVAAAHRAYDHAVEMQASLAAQLESLEYNFSKKCMRIDRTNELKKDSTQTKVNSLRVKTDTQRASLQERLAKARLEEAREKQLLDKVMQELLMEVQPKEIATALLPPLQQAAQLYKCQLELGNQKSLLEMHRADVAGLHSQYLHTAALLYTCFYTLKGCGTASSQIQDQFNELVSNVKQPANVTFCEADQVELVEEEEVLAEPLNATFCVPCAPKPSIPRPVPALHRVPPSRAPTDTTNLLPPTVSSILKKPRFVSPHHPATSSSRASVSTTTAQTSRLSLGPSAVPATPTMQQRLATYRATNPAGRRKRTPIRANYKRFKKPFLNKENRPQPH